MRFRNKKSLKTLVKQSQLNGLLGVRSQSDEEWYEGEELGTVAEGISFKKLGHQREEIRVIYGRNMGNRGICLNRLCLSFANIFLISVFPIRQQSLKGSYYSCLMLFCPKVSSVFGTQYIQIIVVCFWMERLIYGTFYLFFQRLKIFECW